MNDNLDVSLPLFPLLSSLFSLCLSRSRTTLFGPILQHSVIVWYFIFLFHIVFFTPGDTLLQIFSFGSRVCPYLRPHAALPQPPLGHSRLFPTYTITYVLTNPGRTSQASLMYIIHPCC